MFTLMFWKATAERVVRGGAVAVGAVLGLDSSNLIHHASLDDIGAAALYGALGSLVLCLAGGAFGAGDGPSLVGQEVTPQAAPSGEAGLTVIELCYLVIAASVVVLALVAVFGRP